MLSNSWETVGGSRRGGEMNWLCVGKPGPYWVSKERTCSKNSGCRCKKMRQLSENVGALKGEISLPVSPGSPRKPFCKDSR